MPALRVKTESGVVVDDPSTDDLHHLIDELTFNGGNDFLSVSRMDRGSAQYYIQVVQEDADRFALEYRDGGPDQHFQSLAWSVDEVLRVVLAWLGSEPDWAGVCDWKKRVRLVSRDDVDQAVRANFCGQGSR